MKSKATKEYWMIKNGDKYVDLDCHGVFFGKTRNEGYKELKSKYDLNAQILADVENGVM